MNFNKRRDKMKKNSKGGLAIGGCTLIGIGVGFTFLTVNVFYFLASILAGIGLGLVIASFLPSDKE